MKSLLKTLIHAAATVLIVLIMSSCGTMKAMTDLGQAAFNDMGLVVDGAKQKMVENYRE